MRAEQATDRVDIRHMVLRSFFTLALIGAFCTTAATAATVAPGGPPGDGPPQAREVRVWLTRIHEAASRHNFQGTFVVSTGGTVSSARIAHYAEGANQLERSESLDGHARHTYRHNDKVVTLWPAAKVALIEQRTLLAQFPALLQAGDDRIADFYEVHAQGIERVAGHESSVLLVKPRDGLRYGFRLWADQASGLLLRADVIGERNEVLESSAFSDVAIGIKAQPESVLRPMQRLDGYRVLRSVLMPTQLEAEGWALHRPAPGFRPVSCVRRRMGGGGSTGDSDEPQQQVLQTIYSDGLTYVSVFIEPFNPKRHMHTVLASVGPTQTLMQQHGDWWVTVVGDVPPPTLRWFAKALERSNK